jgi:N-acetylmuramic acid 6-phosphate etherase
MTTMTESHSSYDHLELMSVSELVQNINKEDQTVALAVQKEQDSIIRLIENIVPKIKNGGRLFYIGAGTSGRLGILDASECPPTYGVPNDLVIGIIAGGDTAIRTAVENAEDDDQQAWKDLGKFHIDENDFLIGIAASGTTPYVIGGLNEARKHGVLTGCITNNKNSPLSKEADFPVEVVVGPEFVTGSTRMKSGTAQKMVLNIVSTSVMIQLGRVKGNKMVDMKLSNSKLVDRAIKMVMQETPLDYETAAKWLEKSGSVRQAVTAYQESLNG